MLWPSLVVVVCGAIFLRLEMRRRRLTLCGRRDPRDAASAAAEHHPAADGTNTVSSHAATGTDQFNVRSGHHQRVTGSGREMIARRLPASRGQ